MPNPTPWSDDEIRRLLACRGYRAMAEAFPGVSVATLHSAKMRYKFARPDLAPPEVQPKPAVGDSPGSEEPVGEDPAGDVGVEAHGPAERAPDTVPRHVHEKVLRELYEVKHKRSDYLETVWSAVTEALESVVIDPVRRPAKDRRQNGEEVAFALLSDLQCAKITPDYNTEVCRERVMLYAEKIVELAQIQRKDHPVEVCHVGMLGDMVEGVDIFPGQQWLIDSTLYRQIFETTPSILVDFLRYLLANFQEVVVWAVQGNHGRIGRKGVFGPEDNADRMLYRLVKMMMREEPRLTFHMADPVGERAWYLVAELGNYRAMLIHGDQVKGHSGFPWYGLGKKVHSWASGGVPDTFDDLCMGHYHQLASVPLNKRTVWANGAIESTNTFAAETLASQSDPKQWLLFVHPKRARVTAAYPVYLVDTGNTES